MIDHRTPIAEILALSELAFGKELASLTDLNLHSEARLLKAKRTGDEKLVQRALEQFLKHRSKGYKSMHDDMIDHEIDHEIQKQLKKRRTT